MEMPSATLTRAHVAMLSRWFEPTTPSPVSFLESVVGEAEEAGTGEDMVLVVSGGVVLTEEEEAEDIRVDTASRLE
jgi:hypothetical protein